VIFCVFVRGGVGWENGGGKGSGKRKRILLGVRSFGIDQVSCLGYECDDDHYFASLSSKNLL